MEACLERINNNIELVSACDRRHKSFWQGPLERDGRPLSVGLAVERETAESLKAQTAAEKKNVDKRNLYLSREGLPACCGSVNEASAGLILVDSDAFKALSDHEKVRRRHLDAENKVKRGNPNYFISLVSDRTAVAMPSRARRRDCRCTTSRCR